MYCILGVGPFENCAFRYATTPAHRNKKMPHPDRREASTLFVEYLHQQPVAWALASMASALRVGISRAASPLVLLLLDRAHAERRLLRRDQERALVRGVCVRRQIREQHQGEQRSARRHHNDMCCYRSGPLSRRAQVPRVHVQLAFVRETEQTNKPGNLQGEGSSTIHATQF